MIHHQDRLDLLIDAALEEDIGTGDCSTLSCIGTTAKGKAVLNIKEEGILAGVTVAEKIFRRKEPAILFTRFKQDGDAMKAGEHAFEVEGLASTILQCERLVLNCMQRMSGIASLTHQFVEKIKGYRSKILDTRKTTPNFRILEKEAVQIGGGMNHRFGLYDMIMLKDNHIDYCGSVEKAIERASDYVRAGRTGLKIEVETRTIDEVRQVLAVGKVDRIMLDNFAPEQIREAMLLIGGRYQTEASGGIHLGNVLDYAKTDVDFISIGALIHQARSLDLSLKATVF